MHYVIEFREYCAPATITIVRGADRSAIEAEMARRNIRYPSEPTVLIAVGKLDELECSGSMITADEFCGVQNDPT